MSIKLTTLGQRMTEFIKSRNDLWAKFDDDKTKDIAMLVDSFFAQEANGWLNTGHSREFWLCEFAGRAFQGLHENSEGGYCNNIDRGEVAIIVDSAKKLVEQLEVELKGTTPNA